MNTIPGLTVAGFITCWAISPDAIVRLTNLAGLGMKTAVPAIIFACLFTLLCSLFTNHASRIGVSAGEIAAPVKTTFFALFSELLRLTAILGVCLFLPTGMLVSAGFTFNETFLYWFPNFGFSFLLLGIVTGLHLCGTRFINLSQLIFFLITAGCMIALAAAGLIISPVDPTESTPAEASLLSAAAASTLLFLGYDFESSHYGLNSRPQSWTILLLTGAGFCLWLTAAYLHVPPEKLSSSTIPHLIFARQTLGDNGRTLIGIAIISGTCLLTNGLFFKQAAFCKIFPGKFRGNTQHAPGCFFDIPGSIPLSLHYSLEQCLPAVWQAPKIWNYLSREPCCSGCSQLLYGWYLMP